MKFPHTQIAILVSTIIIISTKACSQNKPIPPQNYAGILGGVEWNTISAGWGLEYERVFQSNNKFLLGARATHIFKYKYGNIQLFGGGQYSTTVSHNQVAATGYYFTTKENSYKGFFITSGLGVSLSHIKNTSSQEVPNVTSFSAAFDLGIGLQFYLSNRTAIRWTNILSYGPFSGAFTNSKILIGI